VIDPNAAYDDLVRSLESIQALADDERVLQMADDALASLQALVKHLQQGGHEPDAWAPDNNPPSTPEEAAWLRARGL
jgi:hypothetical protein